MCTVSWLVDRSGYQLFCNRDEKLTRKPAFLPWIMERHGVLFIAPIDGEKDGTWIGTNEFGLSLCLLNGPPSKVSSSARSRGLLLLDLLSSPTIQTVTERLRAEQPGAYLPFTLAMLQPAGSATVIDWDGGNCTIRDTAELPLASSSSDYCASQTARRRVFESMGELSADTLMRFHTSHAPAPGPLSACMHRPDAETVSFSRVLVNEHEIEFEYTPGAPCRTDKRILRLLPRRN